MGEMIIEPVAEYRKTYQEYKAELDAEMNKTAEGFVRIGYLLKVARDTDILRESGYATVTEFAKAEYNIDKTQVSRFIHINDRFSEGGYGDRLEEHYRGFGYAKLTLMLQLPDAINEELSPEYSKTEIQAIKEEVEEESRVTDIEIILEGETETTSVTEDELGKTIRQLGEDEPQLYAEIWGCMRQQESPAEQLQVILAPAGQKLFSVRIRGVGRMQLLVKDKENGNEVILLNLRSGEKKRYLWEDVELVWKSITIGAAESGYREAWEKTYFAEWPIKEKVAPVQPKPQEPTPAPKKEKKVQVVKKQEPKKKEEKVNEPKKTEEQSKPEAAGEPDRKDDHREQGEQTDTGNKAGSGDAGNREDGSQLSPAESGESESPGSAEDAEGVTAEEQEFRDKAVRLIESIRTIFVHWKGAIPLPVIREKQKDTRNLLWTIEDLAKLKENAQQLEGQVSIEDILEDEEQ